MFNPSLILRRNVERWPEKELVILDNKRVSNQQMAERVDALAAGLLNLGMGRRDVVAILMYNCIEFLEAVLAINKIGAVFLPLNYRLVSAEWQYILEHAEAKCLISEAEFGPGITETLDHLPSLRCRILVGTAPPLAGWLVYESLITANLGSQIPDAEADQSDLQRLMYTSGTTSRPKGVQITHGNVLWKNVAHIIEFGISSHDKTLVAGPLYHVGGFDLPASSVLYAGGSLVLLRKFDPLGVLETIEKERITNLWLPPSMVNMLLEVPHAESYDTSTVRCVINGGEKMPVPLIQRILRIFRNAWFADAYGLTETVSGDTFLDQAHVLSKIGSVGKPVLHLAMRVVDESGADVPPGSLGEVVLKGPKVFQGYWRDPQATAAAIKDGWFYTGDIGRVDEDGYLYIEDRKKDMVISGGENIATPEVERVLYEHPSVFEAAVIGIPHDRWGEIPKAFVVLKHDQSASIEELTVFCAARLAKFKVPKTIEFIETLPRNPSGKVLKRELRELESNRREP